jgi:hypothetical protein
VQKLQPFFPPLEPLQSLNLRAALYRCLNELKKNGELGRESVLRKTMLDECKGDKFYEILALLSNVVLKKVLAAREHDEQNATVARKLATASVLSTQQQQSLLPLAIAHKAALVRLLERKEQKRRRYLEFENLLDAKTDDINTRIRKTKDTPRAKRPALTQKEADAIKKQLTDNWIGNQKWLDVMLHGDDIQAGDAFLGSRFDKVWRMVEHGRKLEDVTPEVGLLENLQSRVQEQQNRVQKWKAFHEKLQNDKAQSAPTVSRDVAVVKEFKFDDHLQYQLPSKRNKTESKPVQRPTMCSDYEDVLREMDSELSCVSTFKPKRVAVPVTRRRTSSSDTRSPVRSRKITQPDPVPESPASPINLVRPVQQMKNPSLEKVPLLLPSRRRPITSTPTDSEATLIGHTSALRSIEPVSYPVESLDEEYQQSEPGHDSTAIMPESPQEAPSPATVLMEDSPQLPHRSPPPEPSHAYPSEPPTPIMKSPELDVEEALAEQIITSIGDATPSPVKKPQPRMSMSLIERTRMSMARTNSFEPIEESPPPLPSPELPAPPTVEPDADRHASLLERTRLSMIAMQSKPRQSLAPREKKDKRKSRNSLFPVNQFDTPRTRKSFEMIEESKSTDPERTPKEALFSDEIDYDRVFKSRPRIATSPVFSPPQNGNEEDYDDDSDVDGVTGIDLGDVDQDEDDDDGFTKTWADSPSRMRAGKVKY